MKNFFMLGALFAIGMAVGSSNHASTFSSDVTSGTAVEAQARAVSGVQNKARYINVSISNGDQAIHDWAQGQKNSRTLVLEKAVVKTADFDYSDAR